MSSNRSQARRRLGLALAPVACATLAMAGTGFAGQTPGGGYGNGYTGPEGVTCHVPGAPVPGLPECLPNLELNKTAPSVISPGTITWTITVWHAGYPGAEDPMASTVGIPVSSIHVNDVSLEMEGLAPDPEYGLPKDGELKPGRAIIYTVTQTFDDKICGSKKSVTNTASMTVDQEQSTTADDSHTVTVPVSCTADVGVTKTADKATYVPGDTAKWTVVVTNHDNAPVPVSRIQVDDADAALTPDPGNPTTVLAPGATMSFTAQTAVTAQMCEGIKNTVTVSLTGSGPIDSNAANNMATAEAGVSCAPPAPTDSGSAPGTTTGTPAGTEGSQTTGTTSGTAGQSPSICARVSVVAAIRAPKRPFAGARSTVVLRVRARTAARQVKLTYRLPKGFVITGKPRNVAVRRGLVTVNMGNIARNHTKGVVLRVRITRNAEGARRHTAVVRAHCATARRAVNTVRLRPVQGPVSPAVTG